MYTKSLAVSALLSNEVSAVLLQYRPTPNSVPWHLPISKPVFESTDFASNYPVPDFGVSRDIIDTTESIS